MRARARVHAYTCMRVRTYHICRIYRMCEYLYTVSVYLYTVSVCTYTPYMPYIAYLCVLIYRICRLYCIHHKCVHTSMHTYIRLAGVSAHHIPLRCIYCIHRRYCIHRICVYIRMHTYVGLAGVSAHTLTHTNYSLTFCTPAYMDAYVCIGEGERGRERERECVCACGGGGGASTHSVRPTN